MKTLSVYNPRLDFVHVKTRKVQKKNFNMNLLREAVLDTPLPLLVLPDDIWEEEEKVATADTQEG